MSQQAEAVAPTGRSHVAAFSAMWAAFFWPVVSWFQLILRAELRGGPDLEGATSFR